MSGWEYAGFERRGMPVNWAKPPQNSEFSGESGEKICVWHVYKHEIRQMIQERMDADEEEWGLFDFFVDDSPTSEVWVEANVQRKLWLEEHDSGALSTDKESGEPTEKESGESTDAESDEPESESEG